MLIHLVKTTEEFFNGVWEYNKTSEIRKNDRNYQVGNILLQQEYNTAERALTGRFVLSHITYVLTAEQYSEGLKEGYCMLSLNTFLKYQSVRPLKIHLIQNYGCLVQVDENKYIDIQEL